MPTEKAHLFIVSRTESAPRPFSGHPAAAIQQAAKALYITLKLWYDTTNGLWELWELGTSGPVSQRGSLVSSGLTNQKASEAILEMMSIVATQKRSEARPSEQMTIQEQAAQLCEDYEELFEAPGEGDHAVTQDEERHTATVMHMILPHLASQIRKL